MGTEALLARWRRRALGAAFALGVIAMIVAALGDHGGEPQIAPEYHTVGRVHETPTRATELRARTDMIPAAPGPGGVPPDRRAELAMPLPRHELVVYCSPSAYRLIGAPLESNLESAVPTIDLVLRIDADRNCVGHVLMATADLALIGTGLSRSERDQGLLEQVLGHRLVVPIVHPSNLVRSIPDRDLQAVLTGRIASWRALGWAGGQIQPVCKVVPARSDEPDDLLRVHDRAAKVAVFLRSNQEIASFVARNRRAFGLVSLRAAGTMAGVRVLQVDGTTADKNHLERGSWRLGSTFRAVAPATPNQFSRLWLDYLKSDAARRVLRRELLLN